MPSTDATGRAPRSLRRWNLGVGIAHLAQAGAILALSNGFAIPITAAVQTGAPGSGASVEKTFFQVSFAIGVALFLLLAAADHLLMAGPRVIDWYERHLRSGINPARWIEYSVSASVMVVLIGLLTGISNLYAVIGLFSANTAMILFGWLMERTNPPGAPVRWMPFVFGCIVGAAPWVAFTIALATAQVESGSVPGFVFGIYVSLFVLFNCFAVNQWLQYRRRGRFADYVYGEKVYLVLSLVAKSALAWQVFGGTLAS